jgi:uncharacterized repeat protein (TIGR01451 family)
MTGWRSRLAVLAVLTVALVFAMAVPAFGSGASSGVTVQEGAGPFHVGDTIHWEMTIVNPAGFGEAQVTTWRLTVAGGAPTDYTVPNLFAGGSETRLQEYTITEADAVAGGGKVKAAFVYEVKDLESGSPAGNETGAWLDVAAVPSFSIDKVVNFDADPAFNKEETNKPGSIAYWKITFTNTGQSTLYDISITDTNGKTFDLASLAAGGSKTWPVYQTDDVQSDTLNTATAHAHDIFGSAMDPKTSSATALVFLAADLDLAITKSADKHNPNPGDTVKYTLNYKNLGETPAQGYKIVDYFDKRYVTVVDPAGGTVGDGTITWFPAGSLSMADGVQSLSYTVRIKGDMPAGTTNVDNYAVISHELDGNPSNNRGDERVVVKVEYLPFTGAADQAALLAAAAIAAMGGLYLRRRARAVR